jgi:V8-like Glu-specific endopeptidase
MRARFRRLVLAGIGVGLSVVATPGVAHADDASVSVELNGDKQAAALDHWTPDTMRRATNGDALLLGRDITAATPNVKRGKATVVDAITSPVVQALGLDSLGGLLGGLGGSTSAGSNSGSLYSGGGNVVRTTGKVFFTLSGTDYVCSGNSVAAGNRSLVQTAGHCVNAGPGAFATNFVFVPAYRDGQAPYGRFPARKLSTTAQFSGSGDLSYDVGYAAVSPVNGRYLADTVGADGIAFNQIRGDYVRAFGYPATGRYDGSKLAWCKGTVTADTRGSSDQGLTCNMTGGSSGGPWFTNFNEVTGAGVLNSLNSFKYTSLGLFEGNQMFGPYFGSVIQSVYNVAATS